MNGMKNWIIFAIAFFSVTNGTFHAVLAGHGEHKNKSWYQKIFDWNNDDDDHERGKRKRYQKRFRNESELDEKENITPVSDQTYIDECGACHFAYQPGLLPSGSWNKILAELDDHFGETVDLDEASNKTITEYLKTNSAEHSRNERSVKIMKSLGGKTPMRITEIPYIRAKHRKVSQDVFQRKSIGSLSNCSACHITADKGIFEDDNVQIPQ
jgi:mono/diheme cytochrome c family protein